MKEFFTKDKISKLVANQLSDNSLDIAYNAFNEFANIFGKKWIDECFPYYETFLPNQAFPGPVIEIVGMWNAWSSVSMLSGSANLKKRWAKGIFENGVRTEVYCGHFFLECGLNVCLEPKLLSGRKADLLVSADHSNTTFIEISKRGYSVSRKKADEILTRICTKLHDYSVGVHNKIIFLRTPTDSELNEVEKWIPEVTKNEKGSFYDLIIFKRDKISSVACDQWVIDMAPKISLKTTQISDNASCTVVIGVEDKVASEYIDREADQLPEGNPCVIFLDVASIIGSYEAWIDQVKNWISSRQDKKVSAIVVFSINSSIRGVGVSGKIINNPFADFSIPEIIQPAINKFANYSLYII